MRKHYAELRAGAREGLPTDLARPLSVGKRVIAIHPKTRELHDGKVLTVDHTKCSIMFDSSDLGVEFVMVIAQAIVCHIILIQLCIFNYLFAFFPFAFYIGN